MSDITSICQNGKIARWVKQPLLTHNAPKWTPLAVLRRDAMKLVEFKRLTRKGIKLRDYAGDQVLVRIKFHWL